MNEHLGQTLQQLREAIACRSMPQIKEILSSVEPQDQITLLNEVLLQVEHTNFVWFLQEYSGKENYQQAVIDVADNMIQHLVNGGFKKKEFRSQESEFRIFICT